MKKYAPSVKGKLIVLAVLAFTLAVLLFVSCMVLPLEKEPLSPEGPSQDLQSSEPEQVPEPPEIKSVSLIAVGDNLMHDTVVADGKQPDGTLNYDSYYRPVQEIIQAADVAVINQETILGGEAAGAYTGYPTFNSPHEMGDSLVRVGFDVVLQASNHSMDKGSTGILSAIDFWEEKHPEILTVGLNKTAESQKEIGIIEKNGIRIAVLNYTFGLNGIPLPKDKPYLVNLLDDRELIEAQIESAKEQADLVAVFPHWGTEYSYQPDSSQKELVKFFADRNVDLVIGAHPHVVQPVEWVERSDGGQMLVYYSLGNFLSNQVKTPRMLGGMARIKIEKTGEDTTITEAKMTPVVTHFEGTKVYRFETYLLDEYPVEMANIHGVKKRYDSGFSIDKLKTLFEDVVDESFIQYER